jgi:hypothetical protein
MCGLKRDEVTGGWRTLYNEEPHRLYSSLSIIKKIESRSMRRTGHIALSEGNVVHVGFWRENQKERDHQEDQDVGGGIILKW